MDELRQAQKATVGLAKGGTPHKSTGLQKNPVGRPTLAETGIDKNLPFVDRVGLVVGMRPHERVAILLKMLGSSRQVELPEQTVEPWPEPDRVRRPSKEKRSQQERFTDSVRIIPAR